jgi:hypothetical protein
MSQAQKANLSRRGDRLAVRYQPSVAKDKGNVVVRGFSLMQEKNKTKEALSTDKS